MNVVHRRAWLALAIVLLVATVSTLVWLLRPEETLLPPRVDELLTTP